MNPVLEWFAHLSVFGVFVSGVFVLACGTWCCLGLKFACVAVSTSIASWLMLAQLMTGEVEFCGIVSSLCIAGGAYHVAINICFIGFHLAVGRDAIRLKRFDRRRLRGR